MHGPCVGHRPQNNKLMLQVIRARTQFNIFLPNNRDSSIENKSHLLNRALFGLQSVDEEAEGFLHFFVCLLTASRAVSRQRYRNVPAGRIAVLHPRTLNTTVVAPVDLDQLLIDLNTTVVKKARNDGVRFKKL